MIKAVLLCLGVGAVVVALILIVNFINEKNEEHDKREGMEYDPKLGVFYDPKSMERTEKDNVISFKSRKVDDEK